MIRHTVAFRLKHPRGSAGEQSFLAAGAELAKIPGVQKFESLRQTSPKNEFHFGFSMEFADAAAFAFYCSHPDHEHFVQTRWIPEVAAFQETDYEVLNG